MLPSFLLRFLHRRNDETLALFARLLFSRSWRKFHEAVHDVRGVQEKRLLEIVRRNQNTDFGRRHHFSEIRDFESFRRNVPVRGYDEFDPFIQRMLAGEADVLVAGRPFFYAQTSGTTGAAKYIPVTREYLKEYRNPRRIWMRQVMQSFPGLLKGKILGMHSPKIEGRTKAGVPYGSITVAFSGSPDDTKMKVRDLGYDPAPRRLFLLSDFERRYYAVLRLAAQESLSLVGTINPSTMVLLAKKLDAHAEALAEDLESGQMRGLETLPEPLQSELRLRLRPAPEAAARLRASKARHGRVVATELWPELRGLLAWKGGSAPFYLRQLGDWFPGLAVMDYGYLATEGGFSIPLSTDGSRGVAAVTGHVLEFVPEEAAEQGTFEPAFLADELEIGATYRVIITGSHGLYRYDINDVVRCVGRYGNCAEIEFLHKGGNMLSITGEKVGESHVVNAFDRAVQSTGLSLVGFSVSLELGDPPRYLFAVEPREEIPKNALDRFRIAADLALQEANMEYGAKRSSKRLGAPALVVLKSGAYDEERMRRVAAGAPDSHVKPPHLVRDPARIEAFGILDRIEGES